MKVVDSFYSRFTNHNIGFCAICKKESKLTFNHAPPKICGNSGALEIETILEHNKKQIQHAKNGLKFKTLCSECNNELLGSADEQLGTLTTSLKKFITRVGSSSLEISPRDIAKTFIGHILSASILPSDVKEERSGSYFEDLRNLAIEGTKQKEFNICLGIYDHRAIWVAPFIPVADARKVFSGSFKDRDVAFYSILAFYPIIFIVTNRRNFALDNKTCRLRLDLNRQIINFDHYLRRNFSEKYPIDKISGWGMAMLNSNYCYFAKRKSGLFI